jgi:hypothetical protein
MKCRNAMMLRPAALAVAALLAGCTPNDTTMGGALRHNVALQVIDPDPQAQTDAIEGGSGVRAAAAVDRYNKGQVKQPTVTSTTSGAGGSGSGSGQGPK